jgi:hypothetical protein
LVSNAAGLHAARYKSEFAAHRPDRRQNFSFLYCPQHQEVGKALKQRSCRTGLGRPLSFSMFCTFAEVKQNHLRPLASLVLDDER